MGKKRDRETLPSSSTSRPQQPSEELASNNNNTASTSTTIDPSQTEELGGSDKRENKKSQKEDKKKKQKKDKKKGNESTSDMIVDGLTTEQGNQSKETTLEGTTTNHETTNVVDPNENDGALRKKDKGKGKRKAAEVDHADETENGGERKKEKKSKKSKKSHEKEQDNAVSEESKRSKKKDHKNRTTPQTQASPPPSSSSPQQPIASTSQQQSQPIIDPLFDFSFNNNDHQSQPQSTSSNDIQVNHHHSPGGPLHRPIFSDASIAVTNYQPYPSTSSSLLTLPIPPSRFNESHERRLQQPVGGGRGGEEEEQDIPVDPVLLQEGGIARERDGEVDLTTIGRLEGGEKSKKDKKKKDKKKEKKKSVEGMEVDEEVGDGGDRNGMEKKKKKDKKEKKKEKREKKKSEKDKESQQVQEEQPEDVPQEGSETVVGQKKGKGKQVSFEEEENVNHVDGGVEAMEDGQQVAQDQEKKKSSRKGKERAITPPLEHDSASSDESSSSSSAESDSDFEQEDQRPTEHKVSRPRVPRKNSSSTATTTNQASTSSTAGGGTNNEVYDDPEMNLTIEDLKRDPEFVFPPKRTGPFWDILQTKWTPVKELKQLAEDYNETYKQGRFTASEDKLIKATIRTFELKSGMSRADLLTQINSRRKTTTSTPSSSKDKKDSEGGSSGGAGGILNELWIDLGFALQERALLGIWNHVRRMFHPDAKSGKWTAEQDESLKQSVKEFGSSSWERISQSVGRPSGDCRDRWTKQLAAGGKETKKGKWSSEEEERLIELHRELGNSWTEISKRMGGTRSSTQIRIKWNDYLARRVAADQPSTSQSRLTATTSSIPYGDSDDQLDPPQKAVEKTMEKKSKSKKKEDDSWRWKPEFASILVHCVADLKAKHESEIDWSSISNEQIAPQGHKNLRDRFKYLEKSAELDLRELHKLGDEVKIPFTDIVNHLVALYPESGKIYKRTYRTSEKKRMLKESENEEKSLKKAHAAKNKAKKSEGSLEGIGKFSTKSKELVDSSDDESSSEED